ncbi:hypothetical protein JHK85_013609 [Glycine max]|nr:hypothetical protein JHK85_013609 [Glycine max]
METSSMVISGAMSVLNDGQKAMTVLEGNNTAIFEEDNKTGVGLNGFHTSPSCFLSSEDCPLDTLHYMDELLKKEVRCSFKHPSKGHSFSHIWFIAVLLQLILPPSALKDSIFWKALNAKLKHLGAVGTVHSFFHYLPSLDNTFKSVADEVDNWASVKKSLPAFDSGRQNRFGGGGYGGSGGGGFGGGGGGGGGGGFGGASRADDVDSWAAGKKPVPVRSSNFGSGFRDSGVEPDRWTRGGPPREVDRTERPRLVLDPPRGDGVVNESPVKASNKANPFGAARPREQVLAEKGLDWKKMDSEIETKKTSRPPSSHSSRPSSAQSNRSEGPGLQGTDAVVKSRPKVNPFGDAKPREAVLGERGMDWRKIDLELEHRSVDRPETMEEKLLKEEIDNLKKELEKESTINSNKESVDEAGGDQTSTHAILQQKEKELELLIRDLDDKVRFGQKAIERPGSSAGKSSTFSDRPHSRSGSFEDSRSVDFTDRPRSRGTGDMWMHPSDDRRQFQGSRERGWFSGSRDLNRQLEQQSLSTGTKTFA